MTDFRRPPTINGEPVPTKAPEPPVTEEQFYAELAEQKRYLLRILVKYLSVTPEEGLALFAADQPGIFLDAAHGGKAGPPRILLSVPEELVVNLKGDPKRRDLLLLIHIPRATQEFLEGVGEGRIVLPD